MNNNAYTPLIFFPRATAFANLDFLPDSTFLEEVIEQSCGSSPSEREIACKFDDYETKIISILSKKNRLFKEFFAFLRTYDLL